MGRGDFRFLVYLAGQSVVKSSTQKEEQLGEGYEPGLCCADLEINLPLTFASPRKGNGGAPTPRRVRMRQCYNTAPDELFYKVCPLFLPVTLMMTWRSSSE